MGSSQISVWWIELNKREKREEKPRGVQSKCFIPLKRKERDSKRDYKREPKSGYREEEDEDNGGGEAK